MSSHGMRRRGRSCGLIVQSERVGGVRCFFAIDMSRKAREGLHRKTENHKVCVMRAELHEWVESPS